MDRTGLKICVYFAKPKLKLKKKTSRTESIKVPAVPTGFGDLLEIFSRTKLRYAA